MPLPVLNKERVHRDNLIWLLIAQAVSILPLLFYLPIWLVFFWLFAIFWRVQIHRMKWVYPNTLVKMFLCTLCVAAIYLSFHGVKSVEPMISFLLCSFVLKTVELQSKKDALIVLFIGFITVACQFLFAQDMLAGVYGIFSLVVLLSAWQAAFFSRGLPVTDCLKRGGVLVLQSVPFMVVLFVIMPRLGPLWTVPLAKSQGKTGFSETLQMGDIGSLVRSPGVAFRVSFNGLPPKPDQLYWRGLVLDIFDGRQWRAYNDSFEKPLRPIMKAVVDDESYYYSIVLEPHQYRWLFSLANPFAASSSQLSIHESQAHTLVSSQPVTQKSEYAVASKKVEPVASQILSSEQWARNTSLPASGNEQAKQLARQWRRDSRSSDDIVQSALALYRADFSYTLQPTVLSNNAVDQFLFETKNGFCEHFSSSFVFLMRSAGIPARVVLGYQGGTYNGVDDYFVVKQSDAHAWAEVWLNDRWVSVDPTSAVSPLRVSLGIEGALTESDRQFIQQRLWQSDALVALYQRWDAMGYVWNRWVLNYDKNNQQSVFEKLLGGTSPWRVGITFVVLCSLIFSFYVWLQYMRKREVFVSPENKLLKPILQKLAKQGYVRAPNETLTEFSERLSNENPNLGRNFAHVAKAYSLAVYEGGSKNETLFKRVIKQKS